ncbi:MAG: hypothetical protein WA978_15835 [Sphingopyxis granuli]|uniref:hypothetical protein n=1 Tax=Sphingopyxis granuli TaxID=267128 RepID=UPI003C728F26
MSPTLWVLLDVQSLSEAILALAAREGTRQRDIGRWPLSESDFYPHADRIERWALDHEIDAVVWTALPPGLKSGRGVSPTIIELIAHLRSLDDLARAKAAQYVINAPIQINTHFRPSLETFFSK